MKLRGRGKPKFVKTTDSKHNRKVFPNLITQDFRAYSPNSLWTSDITYIPTKEGWLYLCVVLDCFSITRRALKELDKAPSQVQIKYIAWVKLVEKTGLMETRKIGVTRQFLNAIELNKTPANIDLAIDIVHALGYPEFLFLEVCINDLLRRKGVLGTVKVQLNGTAA